MPRTWTDEQLIDAVKTSKTVRQVLIKLGVVSAGGNYDVVWKHIQRLNLDIGHFTLKKPDFQPGPRKRPIEDYLSNKFSTTSASLRKRLIKEGFFEPRCYECGLTEWMGETTPLELEHIDGNSKNNNLENLTLLCPNCHALTPTYRSKNRK